MLDGLSDLVDGWGGWGRSVGTVEGTGSVVRKAGFGGRGGIV